MRPPSRPRSPWRPPSRPGPLPNSPRRTRSTPSRSASGRSNSWTAPSPSSATAAVVTPRTARPSRPSSTSGSAGSTWKSSGSRKALPAAVDAKRALVGQDSPHLSIYRKCELLGLNRSTYYLPPAVESEENLRLMRLIDEQYLKTPFYGSRRMTAFLERRGEVVNRKRVRRLMALMGLEGLHPRRRTTIADPAARAYPYLLRDRVLTRPDEVWSSDITYVPMRRGFMYLTAVIDWYSRYVLSWRLSNTMDVGFCLEALDEALSRGRPEIFNTDQGSQFTSREYTGRLEAAGIAVSRDGRGRALDNVFVERLWRSVKYEDIYIKDYDEVSGLESGLTAYFRFYDEDRPHQSLDYRTPGEVYRAGIGGTRSGEDRNKSRPPELSSLGGPL